ncbi:MAG: MATE family efflux transporter [Lachnospiraceae bacterium]|nr:MATE family efflux transporter [Lachnospiraceae bacterium]
MTKDLTKGSPMKLILGFGVPLLFGLLFQQFYNMVDTIIVGRMLGVDALAAVGATGSVNFMILGFCIGLCNGFAIPIAQKFGAKDDHGLRKYVAGCAWVSVIFAIVITLIVVFLCRNILVWMRTPENIMEDAYAYIFIIFMGIPATILYNMVSGIIRSLGDSIMPLVFLVISSLSNIVLDIVLIFPFGVAGAALATVIAQGASGIISLIYLVKKYDILRMSREERRFDPECIRVLCKMGVPMGLQYSITAIGSVILQSAVNTLGSDAVAAVTAGTKICMFLCCPFDAMGSTMATYGGQNIGAGYLDRIDEGIKDCSKLGIVYSVISLIFVLLLGKTLSLLFVSADEVAIIDRIHYFLIANVVFYIPLAFVNIVRFMIQGLGYSNFAILAGVCEMAARSIVGFVFVPIFGFAAASFASPVAWICADCFLIPAYFHVMKKLRGHFNERKEMVSPA